VLAIIKEYGLAAAKPVRTGGPPPTFTQVMSGQIDVGWQRRRSASRRSMTARSEYRPRNEIPEIRNQTNRCLITSASVLELRRPRQSIAT